MATNYDKAIMNIPTRGLASGLALGPGYIRTYHMVSMRHESMSPRSGEIAEVKFKVKLGSIKFSNALIL